MKIRVIMMGRGYHTTAQWPEELSWDKPATLEDALARLAALLPEGQRLPPSCLVAVAGRHLGTWAHHEPCVLEDGDELTLIAPVAGG
jgi:sulfur carrier protein ThiS